MVRGDIVDEQGQSIRPERPYSPYLKVFYYRALPAEERIPFAEEILFQDEHLVVVDKPHFLPVTPSGTYLQETVLVRLTRRLGIETLSPLHRIDRETAGVVLFSCQPGERSRYHELFAQRAVTKHYHAVAAYRPDLQLPLVHRSRLVPGEPFTRMREATATEDGAPNTETRVELLQVLPEETHALYRLSPASGKKHQLRVHMVALGIPIVNDTLYPVHHSARELAASGYSNPLQLLAHSIAFKDPVTGAERYFESRRQLQGA
jgi:tRNA pseudouridine32 synthase/23S rRNA pseudouridine746 synthase